MSWHGSPLQVAGNALFDGGFSTLWPLVALPALAALVADRTARLLPRTPETSAPAALLAATPGLVAMSVLFQAIDFGPVQTWNGVVAHRITPIVAVAVIAYVAWRAIARQAEVGRLFRTATAPSRRLGRLAARLGLAARELPTDERECFVAGVARPTVFVSRGALARLGDAELEAALSHERAHVTGWDTVALMALTLLRDIAPYGRGVALKAFRAAREARADRKAAAAAGALNLAGALIALARPRGGAAVALPMARSDSLRWRMQAILEAEPATSAPGRSWLAALPGLAASAALVAWPAAQAHLIMMFCDSVFP